MTAPREDGSAAVPTGSSRSSEPSVPREERVVPMRLQKFLARAGVASRRKSEDLMTAGRVRVNGIVVTELGSRVDPRVDVVTVDGKVVHHGDGHAYLMLNKPAGFVTTMRDPGNRPDMRALVPWKQYPGLYPVGRLDRDTTGLLLFTTDGEMGNRLLHPSHHVPKTYEAVVEGRVVDSALDPLREGILITRHAAEEAYARPCAPAQVELLSSGPTSRVRCTIAEGRHRQVRYMFGEIGHPVLSLARISFGPLTLGDLEEGCWRELTDSEVSMLKRASDW
ncbi:MAG: rRNA pseudouridine synthase [Coriobacteriales bacterium]|jgi:23S rRNA pseudouridine2605 synthase|nr:rRNA pseudouridine synthase [Coriobacteriales bacterium]